MMRLPPFTYRAPKTVDEAVGILAGEGPDAQVVAGGTDLWPNMKRRQVEPKTVVGLRGVTSMRGISWNDDGTLRLGANTTLREIERDARIAERLPGLHEAIVSISTPLLRNMATIGGNACLDTRCFYLNQNYEWRRTINHCLKCGGDTCWTAPGGSDCWAVNSSDSVPMLIALGARFRLQGPEGERWIAAREMYDVSDGREWLTRRPGELLTAIEVPHDAHTRGTYRKLRLRESFDFPVLGVAATVTRSNGRVEAARLVLGAVGPAPVVCDEAAQLLIGTTLDDATIAKAAELAPKSAKPLDNTDRKPSYRKKMIPIFIRRALEGLRRPGGATA